MRLVRRHRGYYDVNVMDLIIAFKVLSSVVSFVALTGNIFIHPHTKSYDATEVLTLRIALPY